MSFLQTYTGKRGEEKAACMLGGKALAIIQATSGVSDIWHCFKVVLAREVIAGTIITSNNNNNNK